MTRHHCHPDLFFLLQLIDKIRFFFFIRSEKKMKFVQLTPAQKISWHPMKMGNLMRSKLHLDCNFERMITAVIIRN